MLPAACLIAGTSPAAAQQRIPAELAGVCAGQPIASIQVTTQPPYTQGLPQRWKSLARIIANLHATTEESVVRRFLAFDAGSPCSPLRVMESERILRGQRSIAAATIQVVPRGDSVDIVVVTRDELSAIVGASGSTDPPHLRSLRIGDRNLFGHAIELWAQWTNAPELRDGWRAGFADNQLFGRAYQLRVEAARRPLGAKWDGEVAHPFFTDLQRVAWRARASRDDGFFPYEREQALPAAIQLDRYDADAGGIIRIGVPGRLSLFGASLSRTTVHQDSVQFVLTDQGAVPLEGAEFARFRSYQSARVNALWGVRSIEFVPVRGLDALTGLQDVRTGLQLGTMFGRSLSVIGAGDDDIFVAADLYAGRYANGAFVAAEVHAEAREDYGGNRWDDIFSVGRGALYVKTSQTAVLELEAEWSAGWRSRTPFQLSLGDRDGGVRGYGASRAAGTQRLVVRMEQRWLVARPRGAADLGVALFADAGRMWAGDGLHARDTEWMPAIGIGVLAAAPPGARRLWRIDLAFPLRDDPHARTEIRLSSTDPTRFFRLEPRDLARSRSRAVPSGVFNWP